MIRQGLRFALVGLFAWQPQVSSLHAEPRVQTPARAQAPGTDREEFFKGTVLEVHAARLFSLRDADGAEILVLAPRELSTAKGATVAVSGTLRRLGAAELKKIKGWSELDERVRARFTGRPVLVASAVMSTLEGETAEAAPPPQGEAIHTPATAPTMAAAESRRAPLPIRASMLVDFIDSFAGQHVRIQNARVVGMIGPGVFLIEPATRYPKDIGQRGRMAVFVDGAQLRVSPELLVGSIVGLEGTARTVLSMEVSGEVPWPAKLDQHTIERLEVRAAILATSVHTAEGTELTDRLASAPRP